MKEQWNASSATMDTHQFPHHVSCRTSAEEPSMHARDMVPLPSIYEILGQKPTATANLHIPSPEPSIHPWMRSRGSHPLKTLTPETRQRSDALELCRHISVLEPKLQLQPERITNLGQAHSQSSPTQEPSVQPTQHGRIREDVRLQISGEVPHSDRTKTRSLSITVQSSISPSPSDPMPTLGESDKEAALLQLTPAYTGRQSQSHNDPLADSGSSKSCKMKDDKSRHGLPVEPSLRCSEPVLPNIDQFDYKAFLNEVCTNCEAFLHVVKIYRERACEDQCSDPTASMIAAKSEFENINEQTKEFLRTILRLGDVFSGPNTTSAHQPMVPDHVPARYLPRPATTLEDDKLTKQFLGSKSRGWRSRTRIQRATTQPVSYPVRCHSCHKTETTEWRRGPNGARSLCNACGIRYAKTKRWQAITAQHLHKEL